MNRDVIMAAYDQGPEAVINLFVETYTKQEAAYSRTRNTQ